MKNKIKAGSRYIGEDEPIYLIAEIGINHNGDLQIAKKLIDATWATEWDCAKFQKRTPDLCVPEHQKNVLRQTPWGEMTYLEYKHRIEFKKEEYNYIDKYCREKPLDWTASVWDIPSLEFLMEYDVPFIKIPSAKLTDGDLIVASAKSGKPLFVSTGMSTLAEIDIAVEALEKYANGNYVLFHTNSTYPAKLNELNLQMIRTLKDRYSCIVGYSGHEYELEPTMMAPIYGASVIERHITLDHNMWGTDQSASLEIRGMVTLVSRIKYTKLIAGDGIKIISTGEEEIRNKLRGQYHV
ncbi:MAG: N-acetylneuraminate synthase family protein [Bacteroidales bacterium]|jgi:N-acetylneuraminate synthase|nr:N-acetylneuraminate synthase family protein [Bacteroidales bacterium]